MMRRTRLKPGKPLERKTPLTSRTELRRTPFVAASFPSLRRTTLQQVSDKRRRDHVERVRVVSALRKAALGRCARCGRDDQPVRGHERRGGSWRSQTMLRPECVLCDVCNGWCEDNPIVAAWTGWKISNKHPHDDKLSPTQARALNGDIIEFGVADDFSGGDTGTGAA